jgi:NDP-sugar pyrophosphorylase family protein
MAPVKGKPFLAYILDQIASFQLNDVIICTGYLHHQITEHFGNHYRNINITYCNESVSRGTGGAVRYALPLLCHSPVLIMNGDSYCNFDLIEFEVFHAITNASVSMLLVQEDSNSRSGLVAVAVDDKVISFKEKELSIVPSLINAGVYIMNKEIIRSMPLQFPYSLENDFFPTLVNKSLYGMVADGPFIDIGTPESYQNAQAFFFRTGTMNKRDVLDMTA